MKQIKTIDVNAREWFDKTYGNSYFSAEVVINYGMSDAEKIVLPFQYGYGDHYQYAAVKALKERGYTDAEQLWQLSARGVITRANIQRNCKKRDLW